MRRETPDVRGDWGRHPERRRHSRRSRGICFFRVREKQIPPLAPVALGRNDGCNSHLSRLAFCFSILAAPLGAQALIPSPREATFGGTDLTLADTVVIGIDPDTPRTREIADLLSGSLREVGASARVIAGPAPTRGITLRNTAGLPTDESYQLSAGAAGALIEAPSESGLLWGVQTLRQLLAPRTVGRRARVQGADIRDAPRYAWRGSMLDVGRHLFPVAHILEHLDWMSRHKLNVFHWHLTEDQGWRIEIDALPRLTEIGAWRGESGIASGPGVPGRYGGFYSKADIRRVVERARVLGITVVPEIEMPGHSRAAIAAYPHLGCTGDTLPVPSTWGVFADVLCPGKESTFTFIETVLAEVLELFPSRYIHVGGDEVPKDRWRECESCQEIIRREHLVDEHGLQRWMIARVGRWLAARGRVLVGWDEIMDGGVPEGATVQVWQGSERITAAIAAGADVIASPQEWVYLNRQANELTLDRVVSFDPAALAGGTRPPGLLGGEAPLWTEHVTSGTNAELMWWPRLLGFAEAMWSGPADAVEFRGRADVVAARMRSAGVAVGPHDQALQSVSFAYDTAAGALRLRTQPGVPGLQLQLHSAAGERRAIADGALLPTAGSWLLSANWGGEQVGETRTLELLQHAAVGAPIRFVHPADARYPGTGPRTLVDGARGGTFNDGFWNGWWGSDLDAAIDLGSERRVTSVALSMLEQVNSWIAYPDTIELHHSLDGTTWELVQRRVLDRPVVAEASSREVFAFDLPDGFRTGWVRVVAKGGRRLPAWHSGAGQPAWIFADEVVVR